MRPTSEMIQLGECQWLVRPLTLRQVQEIEPLLMAGETAAKGNVAIAMAMISIALGRDHADAVTTLGDVEATAPEIGAAMATVLRLGGFIETPVKGGTDRGEAQAGDL